MTAEEIEIEPEIITQEKPPSPEKTESVREGLPALPDDMGRGQGRGVARERRPLRPRRPRRRVCVFCAEKIEEIDYKDVSRLHRFVSERGKMLRSRQTGNCARHQRTLAQAIKRARLMALLPFVNN